MPEERRSFEREAVKIPFIYSLDEVDSFEEGTWKEAVTLDIGPVLVGGLAFITDDSVEVNQKIRIALFMDLELRNVWMKDPSGSPAIYHGHVCRVEQTEDGKNKVAVLFRDLEGQENSVANNLESNEQ
jgi:hypothetical protein